MQSSPSRRAELARLSALPFAHRGLHGEARVENSRAAFRAAIAAERGIELDVRASLCGFPFVFHDATLDRLTDATGTIADCDPDDVEKIRLKQTDETIPQLREILSLIDGRVPLLIEVKASGPDYHQLCWQVAECLHAYLGPVGVMSFNPQVGYFFSRHHPGVLRGLVITEAGEPYRGRVRRRLALWRARPDFLAYDIRDLPSRFAARARARGLPVFTWTCRTADEEARARRHADQIIHELPA